MHVALARPGRRSLVAATWLAVVLGLTVALAPSASAADTIVFRASAQSAGNLSTHRVAIPASVQETDGLLLFVSGARASAVSATPPGWTLVGQRRSGTDMETYL